MRSGTAFPDEDLIGPAPLLRLRGRHRAQLVARRRDPRRIASAGRPALPRRRPAMRRADLSAGS